MAETVAPCGPPGTLSGWELEAWYEDLQDILCSDTHNTGDSQPIGLDEQKELVPLDTLDNSPYLWTLESVGSSLPVDLNNEEVIGLEAAIEQLPSGVLEFLSQELQKSCNLPSPFPETGNTQQHCDTPELDSCCSSSPGQSPTEDEEFNASPSGAKRKRSSQPQGGKVRVKARDQENEQKVSHLVAENERLKGEIERLSMEVEKTRKALINRMVNLKKV
ncbi:hypothetical protein FKM82_009349 [Ascaphus truei]